MPDCVVIQRQSDEENAVSNLDHRVIQGRGRYCLVHFICRLTTFHVPHNDPYWIHFSRQVDLITIYSISESPSKRREKIKKQREKKRKREIVFLVFSLPIFPFFLSYFNFVWAVNVVSDREMTRFGASGNLWQSVGLDGRLQIGFPPTCCLYFDSVDWFVGLLVFVGFCWFAGLLVWWWVEENSLNDRRCRRSTTCISLKGFAVCPRRKFVRVCQLIFVFPWLGHCLLSVWKPNKWKVNEWEGTDSHRHFF